jgi:hypothetical protein
MAFSQLRRSNLISSNSTMVIVMTATKYTFDVPESAFSTSSLSPTRLD